MYARVVVYTHNDDKDELEAKASAGVIPIVTNTPGYISYGVMFDDKQVVSISQWEPEAHAKEADAALAEWVTANTTMKSERVSPEIRPGWNSPPSSGYSEHHAVTILGW
jgi:hypothetical protein